MFFGILGMLGGELWNRWFPINKNLWTSSFVLFSGGFCLLFLSLLYWVTEVKRWRGKWTMPILVFGMNVQLSHQWLRRNLRQYDTSCEFKMKFEPKCLGYVYMNIRLTQKLESTLLAFTS